MTVNQVTPHQFWPSNIGCSIMTLNFPPDVLTAKYGIRFEEGVDDLETYVLAALYHPEIGQIWLWQYENSVDTDVLVDSNISPEIAQQIVIDMLALDADNISWMLSSVDD